MLHAHTDCALTVAVHARHVRVEVRDLSPVLPVQRDYSAQATTGRGLALVAALTDEHGLSDVGPGGKTVWFTITGDPAEQSEQQLLDAWDDAEWDLAELLDQRPDDAAAVTTVRLLGLPPTLWMAARQHHDAMVRELVLHLAGHDGESVDLPASDRARAADLDGGRRGPRAGPGSGAAVVRPGARRGARADRPRARGPPRPRTGVRGDAGHPRRRRAAGPCRASC